MASSVQPLRVHKNTPTSSPNKMGSVGQRPLAELSPMERRRNSPSWNQMIKKPQIDSSPLDSSPFGSKFNSSPFSTQSPHAYWQTRDSETSQQNSENRDPRDDSPAPRRSSIERLKQASRVKNSSMFAREHKQEYDPAAAPVVERPLAAGRPFHGGSAGTPKSMHRDSEMVLDMPGAFASKENTPTPRSPTPQQAATQSPSSPSKSSMSKTSRYDELFQREASTASDDYDSVAERQLPPGKGLTRHPKSVTFDAAPPQINEYEMTTPDPSSVASGSREGSYESYGDEDEDEEHPYHRPMLDDSFDASLEDTEKTPVVLPDDWRFMSPDTANDELATAMQDPFQQSMPSNVMASNATSMDHDGLGSPSSDADNRPLPPLPPPGPLFVRGRSDSNSSLRAAGERVANSPKQHATAPPPPALISKSELQGMGRSSMTLEDRLKLMMAQDPEHPSEACAAEQQRERRLRRASPERHAIKIHEDAPQSPPTADVAGLGDIKLPPRISRESILRKAKSRESAGRYDSSSPAPSSPAPGLMSAPPLDPDVPIPSLESSFEPVTAADGKIIKQEDSDSDVDVYAIPDMYRAQLDFLKQSDEPAINVARKSIDRDDDEESFYSTDTTSRAAGRPSDVDDQESLPTPRATSPNTGLEPPRTQDGERMSLSQFASMLSDDFSKSFSHYMTPSPPLPDAASHQVASVNAHYEKRVEAFVKSDQRAETLPTSGQGAETVINSIQTTEILATSAHKAEPATPPSDSRRGTSNSDGDASDEPRTPESVIRHSVDPETTEATTVPEPEATIKAPGTKLKTRPSLAPADVETMAETRRKVSGEEAPMPAIPARSPRRLSTMAECDTPGRESQAHEAAKAIHNVQTGQPEHPSESSVTNGSRPSESRKSDLIHVEVPVDGGLGLDKEFDRLLEAQKKGYLMRQNTKMVVASSASHESIEANAQQEVKTSRHAGTRSAGNSPVKNSQADTWTTEPWNGKMRRKSIRQSVGSPAKQTSDTVPPLPGASSFTGVPADIAEGEVPQELEDLQDGRERGRLFIKVVGVKDLDFPLPRGERSYFALTLDNGLHCVTTAWLELGKTAPVGQEFELMVLNDLEFQLTLQTKLEQPKPAVQALPSPIKNKTLKPSTFSRVFQSPRKRKELELKQQEEEARAAREEEARSNAARARGPTAWDLQHNLVAKDGSFARAYVSLKDFETQAYGRPHTVNLPCFNEWAMEEARTISSHKSGRAGASAILQRRAPYTIGKLEVQLLYVPKPNNASEEDMPKSMNACVRELQEAEASSGKSWEGFLSQQGGDCPYWRRRFFRLEGPKLTAFHEATRQPRATINLAKASKLIDDKSALTQKEVAGRGGKRRRSAFAAEEEGYMFVEEGFRVRFGNGEIIDFYADSPQDKIGWMRVLADVIGREAKTARSWTEIVLNRERRTAAAAAASAKATSSKKPSASNAAAGKAQSTATTNAGKAIMAESATGASGASRTPFRISPSSAMTSHPVNAKASYSSSTSGTTTASNLSPSKASTTAASSVSSRAHAQPAAYHGPSSTAGSSAMAPTAASQQRAAAHHGHSHSTSAVTTASAPATTDMTLGYGSSHTTGMGSPTKKHSRYHHAPLSHGAPPVAGSARPASSDKPLPSTFGLGLGTARGALMGAVRDPRGALSPADRRQKTRSMLF